MEYPSAKANAAFAEQKRKDDSSMHRQCRFQIGFLVAVLTSLTIGIANADDRSDIRRLVTIPGQVIDSIRISGEWAVADGHVEKGEGGGFTILRKIDGVWRVVHGSGGAVSASHLFLLGAPRADLAVLTGRQLSADDQRQVDEESQQPHWAWLSTRDATDADLRGEPWWLLTIMRNEIFARHGRPFKDPILQHYFEQRAWYHADSRYNDSLLTACEQRNAQFILSYQKRHKQLGP